MTRTLLLIATAFLAAACGSRLSESEISKGGHHVPLADPFMRQSGGDVAARILARHRKYADQVWAAPRIVERSDSTGTPIPVQVLLQVEISLYPSIDCARVGAQAPAPAEPTRGAPMSVAELAALGAPRRVERIWMLPAESEYPGPWTIGPTWLGNFLREAGLGGTVYFPAHHNCAARSESIQDSLPRRVFLQQDVLRVASREPFAARVLQACPVEIDVHERVMRSRHVPLYRFGFGPNIPPVVDRTRSSMRVVGKCASGQPWFELGPYVSDSPLGPAAGPVLTSSEP